MQISKRCAIALLGLVPCTGFACTLPPVIYFPPAEQLAPQDAPALRYASSQYFAQMQSYVECIQGELSTAGGDDAPDLVKSALVTRNNVAVAEVESVLTIVEETLEPLEEELAKIRAEQEAAADGEPESAESQ